MHLFERGAVGLQREGHVARDVGDKDYPGGVIDIDAEASAPGQDDAEGDDRSRQREGKHPEEFEEPLAAHLQLDEDVGDDAAGDHRHEGRGEREVGRVPDRVLRELPLKEDVTVVLPRHILQRERQAVGVEEPDEEDRHRRHYDRDEQIDAAEYE
ncbi:hypothetical protein SDC9_144411 [bioreactor metagenome]|uniref:Uncharacterized protein n=1 Tax=bioreactor metagenome TaxID=1076179 RepID=A0A645E7N4_9ZZZZ